MKKIKILFITILINIVILFSSVKADIPSIEELRVSRVVGYVRWKIKNGEEPVKNSSIKLTKYKDETKIVKQVNTDRNGYFEINEVKSGKYWLFTKAEGSTIHAVILDIKPSFNTSDKIILINLAIFNGDCCEASLVPNSFLK